MGAGAKVVARVLLCSRQDSKFIAMHYTVARVLFLQCKSVRFFGVFCCPLDVYFKSDC